MATLTPAPSSLGLASPALGPWFKEGGDAPALAAPAGDLSVPVTLPDQMEWRAPAGCTGAYAFATTPRPALLAALRRADGGNAFAAGELVVLVTLLPEVEARLAALGNVLPSPDANAVPAGQNGRATVRHLALALPASAAASASALQNLRAMDFPPSVTTDEARASYLGLSLESGVLGNAAQPIAELHRPARDSAVVLKNRTGGALAGTLWAFDDRGRALDPGAVAAWWAHLASAAVFDNLWAHDDAADQRTAAAAAVRSVLFCSAHEGPLDGTALGRLTLGGLTNVADGLYTAGAAPTLALAAATGTDTLPIPRIALLPNGNYAAPPAAASGALFNGWTGAGWPATLARDFVRIALVDIESHLVGLDRTDAAQAQAAQRVTALRNTAAAPFLATADAAIAQALNTLTAGAAAQAMAPVMDAEWGDLTPAASSGTGALPGTLAFDVHALRGEGEQDGGTVSVQKVVVRFASGSLPPGCWVRLWPHGLEVETGWRFRQDGGAARADASGKAFAVMDLADGTGAPTDASADPVPMSFDALIVTDLDARYYTEQRFDRPALVEGGREPLPAPPTGLPGGQTAWVCEQGAAMARAAGQLGSGQTLLAVPADEVAGVYALVDPATITATDWSARTLRNAAASGDALIVTTPAFGSTPEGSVVAGGAPLAAGVSVLHRERHLLDDLTQMGRPLPTMERREVAAIDAAGSAGVVGAAPGRASTHEAVPSQLAHPGVPAAAEIHATGIALAGPSAMPLAALMRERAATDVLAFAAAAQQPVVPVPDPGGTSTWAAVLETLAHGVSGDAAIRAYLAARAPLGGFTPGQAWLDLKNGIEAAAAGIDLDSVIDSTTFDDEALAAAMDNVILKTRDGAAGLATAVLAAIGRAEDFVYLETPALDALAAGGGDIDLVDALTTRLAARPALVVILCVPEKFLPGQPERLDDIRKAGIGQAWKVLADAAPGRVVLFTPTAGSGRALHMASTTVVVDDALLVSGSTHLWRRGLTFDSSLAVGLFDETVAQGRPSAVRAARRQLLADRLGVAVTLVPDDARQMLRSVERLNAAGGLQRVATGIYAAADDTTSDADRSVWNPDGTPGGTSDWYLFLGGLAGTLGTDVNNAIR